MSTYALPSFVVDLISELSAYTSPGLVAAVKEDNGVYQRGATVWSRVYDWKAPSNAGMGYPTGSGGSVSQATSKATGVLLNKSCGDITLNAASLAAGSVVSFTLTNSNISATDSLGLQHQGGGTFGSYTLNAHCASGSAVISIRNNTAAALSEALVLRFVVVKSVTA